MDKRCLDFINKTKCKYGDKFDYGKVDYINNHTMVRIVCRLHGEFYQTPLSHMTSKCGCPGCGREQQLRQQRNTKSDFEIKANVVHENKYDYSKAAYVNSSTKITIICNIHGEFVQTPRDHIHAKAGCPKCGKLSASSKRSKDLVEFVKQAQLIHQDKYDYSRVVYTRNRDKVEISCPVHGVFYQTPHNHVNQKQGCPSCAGKNQTTEEYVSKCIVVHGNKYGYTQTTFTGYNDDVKVICRIHGEFSQNANNHLKGHGCFKCGKTDMASKQTLSLDTFVSRANNVHGGIYDYSSVEYTLGKQLVCIKCNIHGDFWQQPKLHLRGSGCPKCSIAHTSQKARQWLAFLEVSLDIQHFDNDGEYKIPNSSYFADGYCKDKNIVFEFHGDFWHGNPNRFDHNDINPITKTTYRDLYERTIQKKSFLLQEGYTYIECWESDWDRAIRLLRRIQKKWREGRKLQG
jgi:hypothetical protein